MMFETYLYIEKHISSSRHISNEMSTKTLGYDVIKPDGACPRFCPVWGAEKQASPWKRTLANIKSENGAVLLICCTSGCF